MTARPRSPAHWFVLAAAAACLLALVVLGTLLSPAPEGHGTHTQLGLPACSFMELTTWPCPGCGVTTAAALAARGEFARALATQPFGALSALGLALFPLWALTLSLRGRDLGESAPAWINRFTLGAGALLGLGAWIYRLLVAAR